VLRVAFVLRSTEVHPEFFGFVHTKIAPQYMLGNLTLAAAITTTSRTTTTTTGWGGGWAGGRRRGRRRGREEGKEGRGVWGRREAKTPPSPYWACSSRETQVVCV
jgi:hypothetical protein